MKLLRHTVAFEILLFLQKKNALEFFIQYIFTFEFSRAALDARDSVANDKLSAHVTSYMILVSWHVLTLRVKKYI